MLWSGVSPNEILFCPILCCLVAYPCARIFPVLSFTNIPGLHYSISTGQYRNLLCGWSPKDESQRWKRSSSEHLVWTSDPYLLTASVKSAWVPSPTISQAAIQEARRRSTSRRRIQVLTTNGPTPSSISSEHRTWGRSHSAYPVYGEYFRFEFSVQGGRNKFWVYDRWHIHSTYFSISLIHTEHLVSSLSCSGVFRISKRGAKFSLATSTHTKGGGGKPSFPIPLNTPLLSWDTVQSQWNLMICW